jgi:hypothetical protein
MPVAQEFRGRFRFPGTYAFLEMPSHDFALLQFDDPYTGKFDKLEAENTCNTLKAAHQDGDPAILTGAMVNCDVNGRPTPVLFLFD